MMPRDEAALAVYQRHIRIDGPAVAEALLSELFASPEYLATLEAIRTAVSEPCGVESCVDTTTSLRSSSRFLEAF